MVDEKVELTGKPGSHPVGTGAGAAGGAATGAVVGAALGGPVGAVAGAAVGGVAGAAAGHKIGESVNPTPDGTLAPEPQEPSSRPGKSQLGL